MSLHAVFSQIVIAAEEGGHHEPETHNWLLPEGAEILWGGIAFAAVLLLGWKFKVHKLIGAAFAARTARIQKELDDSAAARATAQGEASQIRQAAGDIQAERARLLADAEAQAAALLADGRVRLEAEVAELEARATADIAAAAGRGSDELHFEIARLSAAATERLVGTVLDDATQNDLIEAFISKVGASA
jgi:F-type H+-transporting ATPase subunit b